MQNALERVIDATEGFFKYFIDMKNLERKNGDLKEEISALNSSLREMTDLKKTKNEQLRSLFGIKTEKFG
ncbi:MAG: hypothetical protein L6V93_08550 [Clostridiales bacterium]|nr:MAG: hypothetical protein L6V93_08550 [Clostridiales bacterium]